MALHTHYGKVICACCLLFIFVDVGLASTAFNVYQPYVVAIVGDTGGSMVLVTRTFVALVCMFFVAKWYQILNCRVGVALACLFSVVAFVIFGFADSLPTFMVAAAFAGMAYGFGGMVGVTLLVGRWFESNVGTAVGIASAGSGIATVVVPVIATPVIHTYSLSTMFWGEAVVAFLSAALVWLLLRDRPADLGLEPYVNPKEALATKPVVHVGASQALEPFARIGMMVAAFFIGAIAVCGFSYLSVLMTSSGYDAYFVALMLSVSGAALAVGKFVTGVVFDAIGTRWGSAVFFVLVIVGLGLCCCAGLHNPVIMAAGGILYGVGASLGTVGISVWSLDLSTPLERAKLVKDLQIGYATGGFAFNFLPGPLMDLLGTYVVSYGVLAAFAIGCCVIVMVVYARKSPTEPQQ